MTWENNINSYSVIVWIINYSFYENIIPNFDQPITLN